MVSDGDDCTRLGKSNREKSRKNVSRRTNSKFTQPTNATIANSMLKRELRFSQNRRVSRSTERSGGEEADRKGAHPRRRFEFSWNGQESPRLRYACSRFGLARSKRRVGS
jgi:hypothetical protein